MPEEKEVNEAREGKKKSPLKMVIMLVIVAMVGFMAYTYLQKSGILGKQNPSDTQKTKVKEEVIYVFEGNFLVNLVDEDTPRYLKFVLGVSLSDKKLENEIKKKSVELRDAIILTASAQSFEELTKPEGKEHLKKLIIERMNGILTTGKVEKVYFLDFVIQ